MNIGFLFSHYLLTSVAVFTGIISIILTVRGIVYAGRLGGDGDTAGAKLRSAIAVILTAVSTCSMFMDESFPLCMALCGLIIASTMNAYLSCTDASLLVTESYERYTRFVTSDHDPFAEPPVTPDRMNLPLFFIEGSYDDYFNKGDPSK